MSSETKQPRVSAKGLKVLHAFIDAGRQELSGADIAERTGILSGTLYPILIRFRSAGWLRDRWENDDPVQLGRPKRRYYRITAQGEVAYRSNLPTGAPLGGLAWT
ncbi:DNA-binding PadR family transcriptional regulator [Bradyrhizobium japonicum]|uniref:PadR family transcriptional regulator n=1 Tax=Bradyrhizobium japonicum TaxID=375 RepID=UPI0022279963|nr:PadR family transcriptional regulator [Bradyrhizobium japonicum]MCW2218781.1 DNA-binding PadR family transcriptional regulator [Bradyrhizobium japonicum]MCW2343395.1 DNA-binding PadR family transcriptional regulator [Bradyrhizobium japonicum]